MFPHLMRHLMLLVCASCVMKVPDGFSPQAAQAEAMSAPWLGQEH